MHLKGILVGLFRLLEAGEAMGGGEDMCDLLRIPY